MKTKCFHMCRVYSLIPCCVFVVLHGDVRGVHPVRPAVVYLGSVLLERSAEDPVLDSWGHFPRDGGEGRLLCWIWKHQHLRLCLWVSVGLLQNNIFTFYVWESKLVMFQTYFVYFSSGTFGLCGVNLCPQEDFGSIACHHRQPRLWHC